MNPSSHFPFTKASTGFEVTKTTAAISPASHLLQCHGMRDEHLFDIDTEAAEDQGAGIGGGSALRIEVDLLAGQIRECFDLGSNEDVQFGRKQAYDVGDALLNLRHLGLVLLQ